jgi:hypothetical protein
MDLTTSTGSAGRLWNNVTFTVATTPDSNRAVRSLTNWLKANYTFNPPATIPNAVLREGAVYRIGVQLCNFLSGCGSITKSISVSASSAAVPVVNILGASSRTMRSKDELSIVVDAYVLSCARVKSYNGLRRVWSLWELSPDGSSRVIAAPRSISQDPATYKLTPYTLMPSSQYRVQVNVTSTASGQSATASALVQVTSGDVLAVIAGSSTRSQTAGTPLALDASGSYDEDVQGLKGTAAGLSFSWSCVQVAPVFAEQCPTSLLSGSSLSAQILNVQLDSTTVGSTFQFTVAVSKGI